MSTTETALDTWWGMAPWWAIHLQSVSCHRKMEKTVIFSFVYSIFC